MNEWIEDRKPTDEEVVESYNRIYHAGEFIVKTTDSPKATTMFFNGDMWYKNDVSLGKVIAWMKLPKI